jgi:hypothetical protein
MYTNIIAILNWKIQTSNIIIIIFNYTPICCLDFMEIRSFLTTKTSLASLSGYGSDTHCTFTVFCKKKMQKSFFKNLQH